MNMRYVVLFAGSALAACTAAPGPNAEAEGAVYGYRYHDANHTGDARTCPPSVTAGDLQRDPRRVALAAGGKRVRPG